VGVWVPGPAIPFVGNATHDGAIAFDPVFSRTVYFGGDDGNFGWPDDAYEFDGSWQVVPVTGLRPGGRNGGRMVFDAYRGDLLLFFGNYPEPLTDAWALSGASWQTLAASGGPATGRFFHAAAYDESRTLTVIAGGTFLGGASTAETWVLDSETMVWTQKSGLPSPRSGLALTYDSANQRVLAFGGGDHPNIYFDEFLAFDGESWTPVVATGDGPSPRSVLAMTYDSFRECVIVFGGHDESGYVAPDTFEFDGTKWRLVEVIGQNSPAADWGAQLVYDSVRKRAVYSGHDSWAATYEYYTVATACDADGDCGSGHCRDDLCCESACDGTCQRCNGSATPGRCEAVTSGPDPDSCATSCDEGGACLP
jgi:hypothetical protein